MNYQKELDALLQSIKDNETVPKLLLHSCCAPCSSYVISYLMESFDITVFYFNPNIYPEMEFEHRLAEQKRLISMLNEQADLIYSINGTEHIKNRKYPLKLVDPPYDHKEFTSYVKGLESEREGGKRCEACFRLRLGKTYEFAKANGFDYYGTTLTVSPHKNAVLLNEIGKERSDGPVYLVSDFKKQDGYKISIELSKRFELYRQAYCGCEFAMGHLQKEQA